LEEALENLILQSVLLMEGSSSVSSYCVVELNYYYGLDGAVFVKELAVAAHDHRRPQHWIFRAPSSLTTSLDEAETKKLNSKVFIRCGIKLEEGDVAYERLPEILRNAVRDFSKVFVGGGRNRAVTYFTQREFVSKIIGREVTDISSKLQDLIIADENTRKTSNCFHHPKGSWCEKCYPQPSGGFPRCPYHTDTWWYPVKSTPTKCATLKCSKTAFRLLRHRHNPKYHTAFVPNTTGTWASSYYNQWKFKTWQFMSSLGKPESECIAPAVVETNSVKCMSSSEQQKSECIPRTLSCSKDTLDSSADVRIIFRIKPQDNLYLW
jgi:hypothetical protein